MGGREQGRGVTKAVFWGTYFFVGCPISTGQRKACTGLKDSYEEDTETAEECF